MDFWIFFYNFSIFFDIFRENFTIFEKFREFSRKKKRFFEKKKDFSRFSFRNLVFGVAFFEKKLSKTLLWPGGGNRRILFFFSLQTQVVPHLVPIDVLIRDSELTEAFVQDKLKRQTTFKLLKALVSQLESVVPEPMERSKIPDTVRIGKLLALDDIWRTSTDKDGPMIVDAAGEMPRPVLPIAFDCRQVLVINLQVDRESCNLTAVAAG